MDSKAAIDFIRTHAAPSEQARLQFLLSRQPASQAAKAALLSGQHPDGGWAPFWARDYSSLDATCFRLAQARQLGLDASEPALAHALRFLASRQGVDGSWQEAASVASVAPPWVTPGELPATLYLTANCAYWLAVLGEAGKPARLGSSYLALHLASDGSFPAPLHAHWLAGGVWQRLGMLEPASLVFSYLAGRLAELHPSNLAWLIVALCDAGLPPEHPLLTGAAGLLIDFQAADGRWPSEDGPERDVHTTLEAINALRLCMRIHLEP